MPVLSIEWLLWMAISVALFWVAPTRYRHHVLVAASAGFLFYNDPVSLGLLLGMAAITAFVCHQSRPSVLRVTLGIFLILSALVYFKLGYQVDGSRFEDEILVPLGLSYYTLRVIHLILERFMGRIETLRLSDLARYLLFLPTIQVGPIHRYKQFCRDNSRHRWIAADMWGGIERIIFGYAKITVLGNFLVSTQFSGYIIPLEAVNPALFHYLDCIRYGANLYFQFSGYSDIAIGFSLLLGYHVMENFNNPFLKKNISEFWRAWHISLTSWCREYIATSVTAITRRPALGAFATLIVIALWHEISGRYLVWGLYHGAGIVIWQSFQHWKPDGWRATSTWARYCSNSVAILITLNFVFLSFAITKEPTLAGGLAALRHILQLWAGL